MDRASAQMTGRLAGDPKFFGEGDTRRAVFTVASNRGRGEKRKSNFIDCIAWGNMADLLQHFKKGMGIHIEGRLESDNFETKEGQKRTKVQINIDTLTATTSFGPDNRESGEASSSRNSGEEVTIGGSGDGESADIPF